MPAFRAAAVANNNLNANTTSAVFTIPATAQVGDLLVTIVSQNSGTSIYTPPNSSWQSVSGPDNNPNNNLRTQVWFKTVETGQPGTNVTITSNVNSRIVGAMSVWSAPRVPQLYFSGLTSAASASVNHTIPTVSTTEDNTQWVAFACVRTAAVGPGATINVPTGYTGDAQVQTNFADSPNYAIRAMHLTTPGAAGSYGGQVLTSSAAGIDSMYLFGLLPTISGSATGMQMFIVRGGVEVPITLDRA